MSEKEDLEQFILNNKDLKKLEGLLDQFNIFETLNIVNNEIRHSSVLFWLLRPNGNHGCGDCFVKLFLMYILNMNREYNKGKLTIFDLERFDYSDIEVRREWRNIDLLIVSEKNKFVVVIENKIKTFEHDNQLQRYYDIVKKEFSAYERIFVYLTPEGEQSSSEEWLMFGYGTVVSLIEDVIEYKKSSLSENVVSFMKQYVVMLRRYIVSNSEIEKICRNIYKKHQTALDVIFQYKPDIQSEISLFIQSIIKGSSDLISDISSKTYIRFTTKKIDSIIPKKGEGWIQSPRMLLFEFSNTENKLVLKLIIGPGQSDIQHKLYNLMKART